MSPNDRIRTPVSTFRIADTVTLTSAGRLAPAALPPSSAALGTAWKATASLADGITGATLAAMIDHTLLKPEASADDIRRLCSEAREFGFASVCVNPSRVTLAAQALQDSSVKVCTVVGFPLGATTTATKAAETRDAIANGAHEIDMVINVGALRESDHDRVQRDIAAVVEAAQGHIVKVILETGLLTREQKVAACRLSVEAGAHFVKTSTGFGPGAATVDDIALMRETVGPSVGVKASAGIRDFATAQAMITAGANRLGTSAGVAIVQGSRALGGGY